jgi:polyisoprenoid-binding protein YceI
MRGRVLTATLLLAGPMLPTAPSASAGVRLVVAATGNEARYRVREQLANVSFPTDAVGSTTSLSGSLVLDDQGRVVPAGSKFTVDLTTLKSDRDRRDRFIQTRTLETAQFPTALLVPTELRGLPAPLPRSGRFTFTLVGDLTVHGVTKSTSWQVAAEAQNGGFSGTASTRVTFEDFGMSPPRVMVVLSVADSIGLEYDFRLVPDTADGH